MQQNSTLYVIAITQITELFLPRRVPHVKLDRSKICVECHRVYLNSQSGWNKQVLALHLILYLTYAVNS